MENIVSDYVTLAISARVEQGLPATVTDVAALDTVRKALRPSHKRAA